MASDYLEQVETYYRENGELVSSPFAAMDGLRGGVLETVLSKLGLSVEGRRVLDVGCGRGLLRRFVEQQGGSYTGYDLVLDRVLRESKARFVRGDAHFLPFRDGSFDAVFCVDSFEHYLNGAAVAAEFRRVLRPDGFVFLSVPNYSNVAGLVKWVSEKLGLREKDTWAPFAAWRPQALEHFVTPRYVRRNFEVAGFRRFRKLGYGEEVSIGLFPWLWHPLMPGKLERLLRAAFRPLGNRIARIWPGASLHLFWAIAP
ncbi:MAG: methyltransferase domain-containing protein [Calditrichaeota bacterium]|nr:methyltransferase domain-containing protein [Calditrichota bacterium]